MKHNGCSFQTKSLECELARYCIFNGILYKEADANKCYDYALQTNYSGEINIYTGIQEEGIESWVGYDLIFESGRLVDVIPHEVRVARDNKGMSRTP